VNGRDIQVRLFGEPAVAVGGSTVVVGSTKQHGLLAALAVDADHPVSVEQLIDRIWGDEPPANARATLHVYVSRLRRSFAGGAPGGPAAIAIERGPAGYRLAVDPDRVDLHRFRRLVERARLVPRGDPGRARLFAEALAAARGLPLAGIAGAWASQLRAVLEELRWGTVADWAEAELDLGHHARVVAELRSRVTESPLAESLWAQLLRALQMAGRDAEALALYAQVRRRIVDELGVEPGPLLRERHAAILHGDAGPGPVPVAAAPVPAQLPSDVGDFVGRRAELERLDGVLVPSAAVTVVAVSGTAGVGKTALALHWAHRVADRFPDGQLYLDLRGHSVRPVAPYDALASLLRALGVAPDQVPPEETDAGGLYRSVTAGRRLLLVLDNAYSAAQVRPLLPGARDCVVVATSRRRLTELIVHDGARPFPLDVLPQDDAEALLHRLLGGGEAGAAPQVADLARLCAYLPLALRIAAARIGERPRHGLARYVDELAGGDRLDALDAGDDEAGVRAAFDVSYRSLDEATRRYFRLLGLVPGHDFSAELLSVLAGAPVAEARRGLARLHTAHLVDDRGHDRYGCHDLLREYARELAGPDPERKEAVTRLYAWYLAVVRTAARTLYPHMLLLPEPDQPEAGPPEPRRPGTVAGQAAARTFAGTGEAAHLLDAEFANLVAAIHDGRSYGHAAEAVLMADGLRGHLLHTCRWAEWQVVTGSALAAATEVEDLRGQAAAHMSISLAHRSRCDYPRAIEHLEVARVLASRAGWTEGVLAIESNLAGAYLDTGNLPAARELYTQVLALSLRRKVPITTATARSNLGTVLLEMGRPVDAETCLREALTEFDILGSPSGYAATLDRLGTVLHQRGVLDEATALLTTAVELQRQIGGRQGEASFLANLAAVHRDADRPAEALDAATRAVSLAAGSGSGRTEAEALNVEASVRLRHGQAAVAIQRATRAHALALAAGTRQPEILALIELADAHRQDGDPDTARDLADRAWRLAESYGFVVLARRAAALARGGLAAAQRVTGGAPRGGAT